MSWSRDPEYRRHRHDIPDRGGDAVIPAGAGNRGGAKDYIHEPMNRDEAEAIQIALGQVTGGRIPIEKKLTQDEKGYDLQVPAEWFRDFIPAVKAIVARGGRR
jgi:hypothetical protein